MKTQNQLEAYLKQNFALLKIGKNQLEITGEDGQIEDGSNKESELGLHYIDLVYRQVIGIENMPQTSLALLTLLLKQFVHSLGERDDLDKLNIEWSPHNLDKSLDIEITFGVREPIYLVPVENSPIEFGGKKWGFGEADFFVASGLANLDANS